MTEQAYRDQPHYCRECGKLFVREDQTTNQSVHRVEYFHELRNHPDILRQHYVWCSRYCEERAQHEELQAGRRMYGKGVAPFPKPVIPYERLFPVED